MAHPVAARWLAPFLLLLSGFAAAQEADLALTKTGPETSPAGSDVPFQLTLVNTGPDDSAVVTLNDPLPAGMTFVSATQTSGPAFSCTTPNPGDPGGISCSTATLAAGASASFVFTLQIPPATLPGTFFTNVATVSAQTLDPNGKNDSAVATTQTPPPAVADLALDKSGPSAAGADRDVSYQLTLLNTGPDAAGTVTLSDTLPGDLTFVSLASDPAFSCTTPAVGSGGTITCTAASFASGAAAAFTVVAHVPAAAASGTSYVNTASVTSSNDPNAENDNDSVTTTISAVDVGVQKTGAATILAGQNLSYTLTVANAGPDFAPDVQLIDLVPAQTSFVSFTQDTGPTFSCTVPPPQGSGAVNCQLAALGSGASASFTLVVQVSPLHPGGTVSNTAQVGSAGFDTDTTDDSATVVTAVTPLSTDLVANKSAPATVVAGQTLSYAIGLTNASANTALAPAIADALPPGTVFVSLTQSAGPAFACSAPAVGSAGSVSCSAATLAGGASAQFTLVVAVPAATPNATVLANSVTASSGSPDGAPGNNVASVTTQVLNQADLSVNKNGPAAAVAGGTLTYTLGVASAGPSPASAVQLSDPLPAGTRFVSLQQTSGPAFACSTPAVGAAGSINCTLASMASGASAGFSLTVSVDPAVAMGTLLGNTASVSSSTFDPAAGNNTATSNATVGSSADLSVSKSGPAAAVAGSNLAYTLGVANAGPSVASAVQLVDALPAGTRFVSLQQLGGPTFTCTTPAAGGTGTVTCTLASMAPGASASFTLTVAVDAAVAMGTVLANTASVGSGSTDPAGGNNAATSNATVSNFVDLSASKTGPASVVVGSPLVYEIALANAGTSPALAVQLNDPLPAGTTFVSLAQTAGPAFTCTTPAAGSGGSVTCTLASLPAAATARFTLTMLATPAPGAIVNTATVSSASVDAGMANNASSAATQVVAGAGLPAVIVPTLQGWMLLVLGALLMLGAGRALRG